MQEERIASARSDGFAGEHHVRVLAQVAERWRLNPLTKDLFPTAAGFFPRAHGHHVSRGDGDLSGYVLIECLTGRGWFEHGDRYSMDAGQILLFPAQILHSYGADADDPWSINFLHFDGLSAPAFCDAIRGDTSEGFIYLGSLSGQVLDFARIYEPLEESFNLRNALTACAELRLLLTVVYDASTGAGRSSAMDRVRQSIEWMRGHIESKQSLSDLAKRAGLSSAHYSELFKQATGYPPGQFLLQLKMQHAARLLERTQLPVQEVALSVGITDAFYFSRLFRRFAGVSPRKYRLLPRG